MLQEMGITVWGPPETSAETPVTRGLPVNATAAAAATPSPATLSASPQVAAAAAPTPVHARPPSPPAARAPSPSAATPTAAGTPSQHQLHPARPLYPGADPALTPAALGAGWLIVAESPTPADPLAGDVGRLLDNMLRAMQLHRHPRVYLAALERTTPSSAAASSDVASTLADTVATLKPAMVLVLGHVAARAALGRTEPLGRLRAGPHQVAGCPAVVTYDPAFLLRSQDSKAATWADLCRALATVRAAAQGGAVP